MHAVNVNQVRDLKDNGLKINVAIVSFGMIEYYASKKQAVEMIQALQNHMVVITQLRDDPVFPLLERVLAAIALRKAPVDIVDSTAYFIPNFHKYVEVVVDKWWQTLSEARCEELTAMTEKNPVGFTPDENPQTDKITWHGMQPPTLH